jgi:hypothetical protein
VAEHPHAEARSMTGGLVYTGSARSDLMGAYVYADYSTGRIWGIRHDGKEVTWHKLIADTTLQITGFGTDSKGEMLIEYQGFLIRSSLNDAIIRKYTRNKVFGATDGSYIFRIDEDFHVDATIAGNIARFMNHSCAPNALSRIVDIGSRIHDKRIIIFAARDLQVGEELQYDYQFALGGEKIECHCGAPNCWGRMN